jgi:hypothetical protein
MTDPVSGIEFDDLMLLSNIIHTMEEAEAEAERERKRQFLHGNEFIFFFIFLTTIEQYSTLFPQELFSSRYIFSFIPSYFTAQNQQSMKIDKTD